MHKFALLFFPPLLFLGLSIKALACASCGCNFDCDVEIRDSGGEVKNLEASSSEKSWRFDARYDYLNQNQLRSGVNTLSASAAAAMLAYNQEVEGYTVNNYLTLSAQHDWKRWALRVVAPLIQRGHSTNGNAAGDTSWNGAAPDAAGGAYTSNISGLGDARLIGIFKNTFGVSQFNFSFGFKLPTGGTHQMGRSTDQTSPGTVLVDPGLQLGTGTTDLVYGLEYSRPLDAHWNLFAQTQFQTSLRPMNNYRPGDSTNLNVGGRYLGWEKLTPSLQLNSRWVQTDSGSAADQVSTGGTLVYITPSLAEKLGESTALYQLLQIPLYQFVYGVQLAPQYIASLGIQYLL